MKTTYSLAAGARRKAQLEASHDDENGSWIGYWVVIIAIAAIVIGCMYAYSRYTSVLE